MGRNDTVERLKSQRDSAKMKLRDAQGEASTIITAANRAIAEDKELRKRLGSIKDPAPFIQQELKDSATRATQAIEKKKSAEREVADAQRRLDELDKAAEQLTAAGVLKGRS
jgi:chromosome segregation ATPase